MQSKVEGRRVSEVEIIACFGVGIFAAWFMLGIELAEAFLIVMIFSADAAGLYWLWTGALDSEIAASIGMFALVVITLGSIRVGVEKLSDLLAAHNKACASALHSRPLDRSGSG
jgi:hypothetical protein